MASIQYDKDALEAYIFLTKQEDKERDLLDLCKIADGPITLTSLDVKRLGLYEYLKEE
jgi:hypothetical protein